jgi:hypothetical protein
VDFWDLTKLLVRRWYVSLPLLLSALAGTALLVSNIEPDHILTTHVVLVPPPGATEETAALQATNPWLTLGSALAESAKLSIEGEDVVDGLKDQGLADTYTVTVNPFSPIIDLEIVGDSAGQATNTADRLIGLLEHNVQQLQETQGAQPGTFTVVRQLPGIKIEESDSKVKRAAVAVGTAAILFGCGLTVLVDALLRNWPRRRPRYNWPKSAPTPRRYTGRQSVPTPPPQPNPLRTPLSGPAAATAEFTVAIQRSTVTVEPSVAEPLAPPADAEPAQSITTTSTTEPATSEPATSEPAPLEPAPSETAAPESPAPTPPTADRGLAMLQPGSDPPADDPSIIRVPPAAPAAPKPRSVSSRKRRPMTKRRHHWR